MEGRRQEGMSQVVSVVSFSGSLGGIGERLGEGRGNQDRERGGGRDDGNRRDIYFCEGVYIACRVRGAVRVSLLFSSVKRLGIVSVVCRL